VLYQTFSLVYLGGAYGSGAPGLIGGYFWNEARWSSKIFPAGYRTHVYWQVASGNHLIALARSGVMCGLIHLIYFVSSGLAKVGVASSSLVSRSISVLLERVPASGAFVQPRRSVS
jgi:hypothetical protein